MNRFSPYVPGFLGCFMVAVALIFVLSSLAHCSTRPIYPHSIVPGGVQSDAEAQTAKTDPLIALHYGTGKWELTQALFPMMAWVSKRDAFGGITWTAKAVPIAAGEQLLQDDAGHLLRARCGNRISFSPVAPNVIVPPDFPPVMLPPIAAFTTPWRDYPPTNEVAPNNGVQQSVIPGGYFPGVYPYGWFPLFCCGGRGLIPVTTPEPQMSWLAGICVFSFGYLKRRFLGHA